MDKKTLTAEQKTIRKLSDKLVEIQRPIRILDSCKWDVDIQVQFFKGKRGTVPRSQVDEIIKAGGRLIR